VAAMVEDLDRLIAGLNAQRYMPAAPPAQNSAFPREDDTG
jgi:hypothetical protein